MTASGGKGRKVGWRKVSAALFLLALLAPVVYVGTRSLASAIGIAAFCALLAMPVALLIFPARTWKARWQCPACGYDMRRAPCPICPECGRVSARHARLLEAWVSREVRDCWISVDEIDFDAGMARLGVPLHAAEGGSTALHLDVRGVRAFNLRESERGDWYELSHVAFRDSTSTLEFIAKGGLRLQVTVTTACQVRIAPT